MSTVEEIIAALVGVLSTINIILVRSVQILLTEARHEVIDPQQ